jgi:hypothetical protein
MMNWMIQCQPLPSYLTDLAAENERMWTLREAAASDREQEPG